MMLAWALNWRGAAIEAVDTSALCVRALRKSVASITAMLDYEETYHYDVWHLTLPQEDAYEAVGGDSRPTGQDAGAR